TSLLYVAIRLFVPDPQMRRHIVHWMEMGNDVMNEKEYKERYLSFVHDLLAPEPWTFPMSTLEHKAPTSGRLSQYLPRQLETIDQTTIVDTWQDQLGESTRAKLVHVLWQLEKDQYQSLPIELTDQKTSIRFDHLPRAHSTKDIRITVKTSESLYTWAPSMRLLLARFNLLYRRDL